MYTGPPVTVEYHWETHPWCKLIRLGHGDLRGLQGASSCESKCCCQLYRFSSSSSHPSKNTMTRHLNLE